MEAPAISQVIFVKTGFSVKGGGWGWPHTLGLHVESRTCRQVQISKLQWRDEDIVLPWSSNTVTVNLLNTEFLLLYAGLPPTSVPFLALSFSTHFSLSLCSLSLLHFQLGEIGEKSAPFIQILKYCHFLFPSCEMRTFFVVGIPITFHRQQYHAILLWTVCY